MVKVTALLQALDKRKQVQVRRRQTASVPVPPAIPDSSISPSSAPPAAASATKHGLTAPAPLDHRQRLSAPVGAAVTASPTSSSSSTPLLPTPPRPNDSTPPPAAAAAAASVPAGFPISAPLEQMPPPAALSRGARKRAPSAKGAVLLAARHTRKKAQKRH